MYLKFQAINVKLNVLKLEMYSMYSKTSKHVASFTLSIYSSEYVSIPPKINIFATEEKIVWIYLPER